MRPDDMLLFGRALFDYNNGDLTSEIILRRSDGYEDVLPAGLFFRTEKDFLPGEAEAITRSKGRVLDIGAGCGAHSLVLQSRGLDVTAIDIDSNAVNIMIERGVKNVQCINVMQFKGGPYDTLLMLGHGIGICENIKGLNLFLDHAADLITEDGQIIMNSVDVRQTDDPVHLNYQESNKSNGCYFGEITMQFEYKGEQGPFFKWLHIDPQTLQKQAALKNWETEILFQDRDGEYLTRLTYRKL